MSLRMLAYVLHTMVEEVLLLEDIKTDDPEKWQYVLHDNGDIEVIWMDMLLTKLEAAYPEE